MARDGLNKEVLRILAVALLLVLAGCQTTLESTPTPEPTTTNAPTTTPTATATSTSPTATATATSTPFRVNASFPNCTAVKVQSPSYEWVVLVTDTGNVEHTGTYSGTNSFTADEPIQYVIVAGDSGQVEVENPDYAACVATPTPTPTSTPTPTPTATPTPTPTATPVTTTTTQHHTHTTTTATPRPPVEDHTVPATRLTTGENKTKVTHWLKNFNDHPVRVEFTVFFYYPNGPEGPGYAELIAGHDKHTMVLEPGERVNITSTYSGNRSIVSIDFMKELEWADE